MSRPVVKFPNTHLVFQSAALRLSLVLIPESAAAKVDAPLVEWAVKVLMSIPDIYKTSFNQRAIVQNSTRSYWFVRFNNCNKETRGVLPQCFWSFADTAVEFPLDRAA